MKAADVRVEANKAFTLLGKQYKPGDPVNVAGLSGQKISQLLNLRYLRPVQSD